ncbi:MAG: HAD-IA family hydrolase [Galactobacter sp.]
MTSNFPLRLRDLRAVLFDLDGVLTPTADVHTAAWKATFTDLFAHVGLDSVFTDDDYLHLVDGKPRYDGVRSVLLDRGIDLPEGTPEDTPGFGTVCAVGNQKNTAFRHILDTEGVAPYEGSLAFLDHVVECGLEVAVVSSSRNARSVLAAAEIDHRFSVIVDGIVAAEQGLPGKPAPDTYLAGAEELGWLPEECIVVEDAVSGVRSGAAGGFGLVVGVAREASPAILEAAGADVVVNDLGELVMDNQNADADPWSLSTARAERSPSPEDETVFATGNGYLGVKWQGADGGRQREGTFINGLYEAWKITYPENSYGQAESGQTMIAAPDAAGFLIYVDDEALELGRTEVDFTDTRIDFGDGTLTSTTQWRTARGDRVNVKVRQLVSFEQRHLAMYEYTVRPLDRAAHIHLRSTLVDPGAADAVPSPAQSDDASATIADPRKSERTAEHPLVPSGANHEEDTDVLSFRVRNSGMTVAAAAAHDFRYPSGDHHHPRTGTRRAEDRVDTWADIDLEPGQSIRLVKYVTYHSSRRQSALEMRERALRSVKGAQRIGVSDLYRQQRRWAQGFWERSDVEIHGVDAKQQSSVRWNLWQLAQASARADGLGISAKGVSGNGYSGHYFWDTEIFVVPFLTYTNPQWARNALRARVNMLPKARMRARQLAEHGALFPWRTINGDEAGAYFPAGTAQYHINADIAAAMAQYIRVADDPEFLSHGGAQVLVETARLWTSLGFWRTSSDGRHFHIHGVTGPDEYTALVNDNTYTNVMAAFNLQVAAYVVRSMQKRSPARYTELAEAVQLDSAEPDAWAAAAEGMYVGYDENLGIHPQDESFLDKEVWDVPGTPQRRRPLLLHYHPLVLYRYQVLKQADTVLALLLRSSRFTLEQKKADFDYYDPLTTGDSTLSAAVQSIIAAEVGYADLALEYFEHALRVDLDNLHRNTSDGVHVASTGGVWAALVNGFAGLRDDDGSWRFSPRLPASWEGLTFRLARAGTRVRFRLTSSALEAEVELGSRPVTFFVGSQAYEVVLDGGPVTVALADQGPVLPGRPSFSHMTRLKREDGSVMGPTLP